MNVLKQTAAQFLYRNFLLTVLLLFSCNVYAADSVTPVDQTQSQIDAANAYNLCMNNAVNGTAGCNEANECAGMLQSFTNSTRQDVCKLKILGFCLIWGHKQNSQSGWVAVGQQHLANAQTCQSLKFDATDKAKSMLGVSNLVGATVGAAGVSATDTNASGSSGVSKSSVATDFSGYDDGSSAYGLANGEILNRALNNGEKLGDIIASSPFGDKLTADQRDAFRNAGNDPKSVDLTGNGGTALAAGNGANEENFGDALAGEKIANPGLGGNTLDPNAAGSCSIAKFTTKADCLANGGVWTLGAALAANSASMGACSIAKFTTQTECIANGGVWAATDAKRSLASNDASKYGGNRYGEKTLFQMVSTQYKKKTTNMLSFDYFLNKNKAANKAPTDAKAEIERGLSL